MPTRKQTKEAGERIGGSLGIVKKVDVQGNGFSLGNILELESRLTSLNRCVEEEWFVWDLLNLNGWSFVMKGSQFSAIGVEWLTMMRGIV